MFRWTGVFEEFEKGNSQAFTTPEHFRPAGQVEFTASESAHVAMHTHMLKQESKGNPLNHETLVTSRMENRRLYPNPPKLIHGHESGVERAIMLDKTTGKEYSPFNEAVDPYHYSPIPKGTDL